MLIRRIERFLDLTGILRPSSDDSPRTTRASSATCAMAANPVPQWRPGWNIS